MFVLAKMPADAHKKIKGNSVHDLHSQQRSGGGCSRRDFLSLAAAVLSPPLVLAAGVDNARRIDVHHHFLPQSYADFMRRHGLAVGFGKWDVQSDLEDMDAAGIATAVLSITSPGFGLGHEDDSRRAVRAANEAAVRLQADHPGRFASFAALPLTDTDGALHEIDYALDTLKAVGLAVFSSYGDRWLGHPAFAPIYEELNRRKAVVFVHPILANCCANIPKLTAIPNEAATIEFGTDTTRAIADLIFSGTTTRYPDMTWIFSHGGGTMPFLIERFLIGVSAEIVPGVVTQGITYAAPQHVPHGVLHELRRMYYDTAQASNPVAMGALRTLVPVSQILFGTDVWFRTGVETARNLTDCKVFNAAELRAINHANAQRLLPGLPAPAH